MAGSGNEAREQYNALTEILRDLITWHFKTAELLEPIISALPEPLSEDGRKQIAFHRAIIVMLNRAIVEREAMREMLDTSRKEPTYDLFAEFINKRKEEIAKGKK